MNQVSIGEKTIVLIRADITTLMVDAIVNAANESLTGGSGVNGAVHKRGGPTIMEECAALGGCATGEAVVTKGGELDAKFVIHAVAPQYAGRPQDGDLLRKAYSSALARANERALKTIAFPSLGTGNYSYPIEEASEIAISTVVDHLRKPTSITRVIFALFSEQDLAVYDVTLKRVIGG